MNSTDSPEASWVGWQGGSNVRGTWDILLSCFLTLFLASWTALHLNIEFGESAFLRFRRHLMLVFCTVMFSDAVLHEAFKQLRAAARLRSSVNEIFAKHRSGQQKSSLNGHTNAQVVSTSNAGIEAAERGYAQAEKNVQPQTGLSSTNGHYVTTAATGAREPPAAQAEEQAPADGNAGFEQQDWSLKQAFWVITGGLAVRYKNNMEQSIIVTQEGVVELAEQNLLPGIPEREIDTRSKSDNIGKLFVVLQAAWFFVQLFGRLA